MFITFALSLLSTLSTNATLLSAPFNNMQTLKFKAQLRNAFFATGNQMLGGSSQLPTAVESCSYAKTGGPFCFELTGSVF